MKHDRLSIISRRCCHSKYICKCVRDLLYWLTLMSKRTPYSNLISSSFIRLASRHWVSKNWKKSTWRLSNTLCTMAKAQSVWISSQNGIWLLSKHNYRPKNKWSPNKSKTRLHREKRCSADWSKRLSCSNNQNSWLVQQSLVSKDQVSF